MKEIEIERVFLVKKLPPNLDKYENIVIKVADFFEPNAIDALKLKQKGDKYVLVKKEANSALDRIEHNIMIKKGEFDLLWNAAIQKHEKQRYYYPIGKLICEIDLYKGNLLNYIRVEVEFKSAKEAEVFTIPDWFGDEITNINHEIHEDLGIISFNDLKMRYAKKGISLKKVYLNS